MWAESWETENYLLKQTKGSAVSSEEHSTEVSISNTGVAHPRTNKNYQDTQMSQNQNKCMRTINSNKFWLLNQRRQSLKMVLNQ